jgi:P27 family predicted phage terminase small subunit
MRSNNRPAPPEDLAAEGFLEWGRVCDELGDRIDPSHRAILTIYVETWAMWTEAARVARALPPGAYADPAVVPPAVQVMTETGELLRQLLNDLGLTPAARDRRRDEEG